MSIGEHLEELRMRLILGLGGYLLAAIFCFIFGEKVVVIFCRPLMIALEKAHLPPLVYTRETQEAFMVYIKISMISAAALAGPWLLYQLWQFVAAGLYARERKYVTKYLPLSITLLLAGMSFLYFFVLPLMVQFFLLFNISLPFKLSSSWSPTPIAGDAVPWVVPILDHDPPQPLPGQVWFDLSEGRLKIYIGDEKGGEKRTIFFGSDKLVTPQITLSDYVDMVMGLLLSFGLAFQLPLVVLGAARIGVVDIEKLKKWRRYVYFSMSIISAVIVPDVVTGMIALMIPLILLYEFGIVLARMAEKNAAATAT